MWQLWYVFWNVLSFHFLVKMSRFDNTSAGGFPHLKVTNATIHYLLCTHWCKSHPVTQNFTSSLIYFPTGDSRTPQSGFPGRKCKHFRAINDIPVSHKKLMSREGKQNFPRASFHMCWASSPTRFLTKLAVIARKHNEMDTGCGAGLRAIQSPRDSEYRPHGGRLIRFS